MSVIEGYDAATIIIMDKIGHFVIGVYMVRIEQ